MTKNKANLLLFVVAIFWGFGTCMMKLATSAELSTGLLNGIRGFIFALLSLLFFGKRIIKMTKKEFKLALIAGFINTCGFIIQTIGITSTTPAKCGFITGTYIVFIPVFVFFVYHQKIQLNHLISIVVAIIGMAILTGIYREQNHFNRGDLLSLISAMFYALSIAYLGNTAKDIDFSIVAFMLGITLMIGGGLWWIVVDKADIGQIHIKDALISVLYLSVVTSFICQSIQIFAQKYTKAVIAGLILMLEGFFALVFSILLGYDVLSYDLVVGGIIMMIAFVLAEISLKRKKKNASYQEMIAT